VLLCNRRHLYYLKVYPADVGDESKQQVGGVNLLRQLRYYFALLITTYAIGGTKESDR